MKSKEQIEVWINADGDITINAVGYSGNTCEEATRFLEEGLGIVGRKQRSRDYYRKNRTQNSTQQEQKT